MRYPLALSVLIALTPSVGRADSAPASADREIQSAIVQAETLRAAGKDTQAIALLQRTKVPTDAAGRRALLLLGTMLCDVGRRKDAERPLLEVIDAYNRDDITNTDAEGLAVAARAAYLLRSPKDANTLFNKSERVGPPRIETLLWRAELFLNTYDPAHAELVIRDALKVEPERADLFAMMARVKLEAASDLDEVATWVTRALRADPHSASAFAVRAGAALRDLDFAQSAAAIEAGLASRPGDLELMSLKAAMRFLEDDRVGFSNAKRDVFARNPEYARFYGIVGDVAEWEHRYDDIVGLMKEATALDPEDGKAWAQLGLMQIRSGDDDGGLKSLRRAWSLDPFNVRVFNTLNLYEEALPQGYETTPHGVFRIRYPRKEKAVLERYVPALLEEAWGVMTAHYGFTPSVPTSIELYSTREQFSVRTSGLPNIGIQGVCFGRVLAAMSPGSESFNWGEVLWHELGHVFAIQRSKSRVPRWFTEGLSEYETIIRRPEWRRALDPKLYSALRSGRLPGALAMNRAFTHAESDLDVTVAYYASSQMLVFTAESFGMHAIVKALALWGDGRTTDEVIKRAFGVDPSEYDARFRAWALGRLHRYDGQFILDDHPQSIDAARAIVAVGPSDAAAHAGLALSTLVHGGDDKETKRELDEALRLDPGQATAHYVTAMIAIATRQPKLAEPHLDAIRWGGGDGYAVQMEVAHIAQLAGDTLAASVALDAASRFDPTQPDPLRLLLEIAAKRGDERLELDVLRRLAPVEPHDRRPWQLLLAKLVATEQWDEAIRVGESAILLDVETGQTHVLYARALDARGEHARATFEFESALACAPPPPEAAAVHVILARRCSEQRDPAGAKRHRDEALRLDPDNKDANQLVAP